MKQYQTVAVSPPGAPTVMDTLETRDGLASRLSRFSLFDGLQSRMAPSWAVLPSAHLASVTMSSPAFEAPRLKKSAGVHSS